MKISNLLALAGLCGAASLAMAQPANDNCDGAFGIGIGAVSGDTTTATADGTGCFSGTRDVWYAFTAPCNGFYRFETCGSSYDTVISVHTGCPGEIANQITCNDDFCGLQSQINVPMNGGTTYLVRVAGFTPSRFGPFTLTSSVVSQEVTANDACGSAAPIGLGSFAATNRCASTDGGTNCGFNTQNDVWYSFSPSCSGTYTFDTCGPRNFDTVLSLFTGCGGDLVACNDDSCELGSRISANLAAGSTYVLRVAGFNGAFGDFTLNVVRDADTFPSNDACANAVPVGVGASVAAGSTSCASPDGAANCGLTTGSNDVWYSFTADCGASYAADTVGSGYDTVLSVHSGCPGDQSTLVTCNDDGAGFPFSRAVWTQPASTTYYIRVAGFNGANGNFNLNISNLPNDNCANGIFVSDGATPFSNRGANTDGVGDGLCLDVAGQTQVNQDIWYIYQANCNGVVTVDTRGSGFDTKIAAYSDAFNCPPTSVLACNDDFFGLQSFVQFPVTAGSVYTIRVGGYFTNSGCGVLNIACTNPCPWQADGCYADYNNDDSIDGDDVIAFFAEWDSNGPCADATGDESTDGDDVIAFFTSWDQAGTGFPGC